MSILDAKFSVLENVVANGYVNWQVLTCWGLMRCKGPDLQAKALQLWGILAAGVASWGPISCLGLILDVVYSTVVYPKQILSRLPPACCRPSLRLSSFQHAFHRGPVP